MKAGREGRNALARAKESEGTDREDATAITNDLEKGSKRYARVRHQQRRNPEGNHTTKAQTGRTDSGRMRRNTMVESEERDALGERQAYKGERGGKHKQIR